MLRFPDAGEIENAVAQGAAVMFGFPTEVKMRDGAVANLDLGAASRGISIPWNVRRVTVMNGVQVIEVIQPGKRTISIGGTVPSIGTDVPIMDRALSLVPSDPHAPDANDKRLEAGRVAFEIRDAHLRAATISAVDGWSAARDRGIVDEDPVEGTLCAAPEETEAKVLIVKCPSTGRIYGHLVPIEMTTARAARRWMMGLPEGTEMGVET